jgi:hypothetical protein
MPADPCRICGEPVRMVQGQAPRRLGQKAGSATEVRRCTNPVCSSNTGKRKMGQQV